MASQKRVGVILSGCGFLDGAEIHEATCTLLSLDRGGAKHVDCRVEDAVVDERLKLVSTPAYMLGPWIAPVAAGIDKLVAAVLEMT